MAKAEEMGMSLHVTMLTASRGAQSHGLNLMTPPNEIGQANISQFIVLSSAKWV